MLELGESPVVKLTDFGLARTVDDASFTRSGLVSGTPMYMAPEQARGDKPDHRSDLFSLGSVLYVMVTGRPPFRANSSLAVMARVAEATPRPIQETIPETPSWLCDLIAKLHARNPEDRYASADEVAKVLERSLAAWQLGVLDIDPNSSRLEVPTPRKTSVPAAQRSRGRLPIAVAAVTALIAGIAATRFAASPQSASSQPDVSVVAAPPELPKSVDELIPGHEFVPSLERSMQANRVTAAIRKLNPKFLEPIKYDFLHDRIVGIEIDMGADLKEPSPFRELVDLRKVYIYSAGFTNFEAFRGRKLENLRVSNTSRVNDLSALKGMPLKEICLWGFSGTDLSPLVGMKLEIVNVGYSRIRNLSVFRGMPIASICVSSSEVDDLEVLRDMPLKTVMINDTKVTDLEPLRGKSLRYFVCKGIRPKNGDVIWDFPLEQLEMDFRPADFPRLRAMTTLKLINEKPAAEFLKQIP